MNHPERKSPRLARYDYSLNGQYFVTICVQNRLCLFGNVRDAAMLANPAGQMVADWWNKLSDKYSGIACGDFVVMPNHIHGIMLIENLMSSPAPTITLPQVMQWFKAMTTNHYIRGVNESGWHSFNGKLWQRSYHDHIIRDEPSLVKIQQYIQENPRNWAQDTFFDGD